MPSDEEALCESDLEAFIGTSQYHRHSTGLLYTDGIQFLAEKGGCYWLIDAIGIYQREPDVRKTEFQLWELAVEDNRSATLEMREDTGMPAIVSQNIGYTDFPLRELQLYLTNKVLYLPSEH